MRGRFRRPHPVWGGVILVASLLAAVGVAWNGARNAPSSAIGDIASVPRPAVAASDGCQKFASHWINDTSIPVEPSILEGFTNCRMGDDGRWYVWVETPGLDRPAVPAQFAEDAQIVRTAILDDIRALQSYVSPELGEALGRIYSESANAVIGQTNEGVTIANARTRHARLVNAFALDPERSEFADYVGWVMKGRMDAYGVFRRACLENGTLFLWHPCVGMEDNLSIRYAPWYWELANPLLLDSYLSDRYSSGESSS
ncbi:hypothetical protein BH23CHL5_BH23CHL5_07790 [soil metagenome]